MFSICTSFRQTIFCFWKVIKGMEFVDQIKKGDPNSGAVSNPDKIISLKLK